MGAKVGAKPGVRAKIKIKITGGYRNHYEDQSYRNHYEDKKTQLIFAESRGGTNGGNNEIMYEIGNRVTLQHK